MSRDFYKCCAFVVACLMSFYLTVPGTVWSQEKPTYKIGTLTLNGRAASLRRWNPTAWYLSEQIPGATFEIVPLSYAEIVTAVASQDVDFVLADPGFYVRFETDFGAERIATLLVRFDHKAYSYLGSAVFVAAGSDLKGYEDFKGAVIAALDPGSFDGYQAAKREFLAFGAYPGRDFTMKFVGGSEAVVAAVLSGEADAGILPTGVLESLSVSGKIDLGDVRVLHRHRGVGARIYNDFDFLHSTRLYPGWPLAKLAVCDDEIAQQVAVKLFEIKPDLLAAVRGDYYGWTIPKNYGPVHQCLKELKAPPYEHFGKITARGLLAQYRFWIITVLILIVLMVLALALVLILAKRSYQAQQDLKMEMMTRKKAEEAIRHSEENFRELFDNIASGVIFYEVKDQGEDFMVKDINKAGQEISKIKKEDVVGKRLLDVFPAMDRLGVLEQMREVVRNGQPKFFPACLYEDGRVSYWAERYIYKIQNGDIVVVYSDISERAAVEEQLRTNMNELEKFFEAAVGREERMIELKKQVNDLSEKTGEKAPYDLSFLEEGGGF